MFHKTPIKYATYPYWILNLLDKIRGCGKPLKITQKESLNSHTQQCHEYIMDKESHEYSMNSHLPLTVLHFQQFVEMVEGMVVGF